MHVISIACAAVGHTLKESKRDAEKFAREALNIFQESEDRIGIAYANGILKNSMMIGAVAGRAEVTFDDLRCAHVVFNEMATQHAFQSVIDSLLMKRESFGCIVLHLEGGLGAGAGLQSWAVASGTFIMGLRCVGRPVVLACWGKIAGPSWGFVLCCDYRICATQTSFVLPIWGSPETLGDLAGHNNTMQMNLQNGPTHALSMLETGIVHECYKGEGVTRKAASELAKRIASNPSLPICQGISLMSVAAEMYALSAARGSVSVDL